MAIAKYKIEKIINEEINNLIKEAIDIEINEENLDEGWRDRLANVFAGIALTGSLSSIYPNKDATSNIKQFDKDPKMDMLDNVPTYDYGNLERSKSKPQKYIENIKSLETSEEGINAIKEHEKLRLRAYKLGDGMITVGWGHAEPIGKSRYRVGEKITKKEADRLFKKDLQFFENGVRNMFLDWTKEGVYVPVTQSMFDALVSMAYNMGVYGLKKTDFIDQLKSTKDPKKVANKIKKTKISYPGHIPRREKEYQMFISDLDDKTTNQQSV